MPNTRNAPTPLIPRDGADARRRARPCVILADLSISSWVNVPTTSLAAAVSDVIRDSPQLPQMIVKSFKLAAIPEVRHLLPTAQTAALFEPSIMTVLRRRKYIIAMAHEFGAHQISLHHSLVTPKLGKLAAEANMPVTIWTADHPKWVRRCRKLGIKALITNDPARLLAERDS